MQTIIRLAPLLLMSAGFIVAFQAGLWNLGGDGQFLLAAAVVGGLGAPLMGAMPFWLALILLCSSASRSAAPGRSCPRSSRRATA